MELCSFLSVVYLLERSLLSSRPSSSPGTTCSHQGHGLRSRISSSRAIGSLAMLFQTNLAGYFRLAFSPGDIFLLGLFSTPTQVALYGFAAQLAKPLTVLNSNLQVALTPEVTTLWADQDVHRLRQLTRRYIIGVGAVAAVLVAVAAFLAEPIILLISTPILRVYLFFRIGRRSHPPHYYVHDFLSDCLEYERYQVVQHRQRDRRRDDPCGSIRWIPQCFRHGGHPGAVVIVARCYNIRSGWCSA